MLTFFLPKVLGSSTPCNFSTSEKFQEFRAPVSSFYLLSWAVSLFLFSSLRFISPFCQKVDFWSSFDIWYILHDIFLPNIDNSGEVLEAPENSNPFTCFLPSIISVSTCKGWLTPQRPPLRNETLISEGGTLEGGRLTMVINPSTFSSFLGKKLQACWFLPPKNWRLGSECNFCPRYGWRTNICFWLWAFCVPRSRLPLLQPERWRRNPGTWFQMDGYAATQLWEVGWLSIWWMWNLQIVGRSSHQPLWWSPTEKNTITTANNNSKKKTITLLRVIPAMTFQNMEKRHTCFLDFCASLSCPARYSVYHCHWNI